jgi:transposase
MKTLSLDFREKILAACDAGQSTQQQVAGRFLVSLGMVKKLLAQRKATGDIAPRHKNAGRKPKITPDHQRRLRELIDERNDWTLEELRDELGVACTPQAIHYALKRLGISYKKSLYAPANNSAPTFARGARPGSGG